jgi:hypothetical protein
MVNSQPQAIPEALNLDTGWSLSEHGFALVLELFHMIGVPRSFAEFGSGRSTVRFSLAFPEASILSLESDWMGFQEAKRLQHRFGCDNAITLRHDPLVPHSYGYGEIFSYQSDPLVRSGRFDCVIIDGPPFYVLRGREICLYEAYASLELGGFVILDDYYRKAEQTIVSNWFSVYPGSFRLLRVLNTSHGMAILQKIKSVTPNWQSAVLHADRQKIIARRTRVRDALVHLDDNQWLFYLKNMYAKDGADRFPGMISAIRDCHRISPEQIATTVTSDALLSNTDRKLLLDNCFKILQDEIRE